MNAIEKKLWMRPPAWWHCVISKDGRQDMNVRCKCRVMLRAKPGGLVKHCGIEYQAPESLDGLPARVSTGIVRKLTARQKFLQEHNFDLTKTKWLERMKELENEIDRQATLQAGA